MGSTLHSNISGQHFFFFVIVFIYVCCTCSCRHELSTNEIERMTAFKETENTFQRHNERTKEEIEKRMRKMQLGTYYGHCLLLSCIKKSNKKKKKRKKDLA